MLGLADVIGPRRNVVDAQLSVRGQPIPQLRIRIDLHGFGRPRGSSTGYAGTELDARTTWSPGGGLRVSALAALFGPGVVYRRSNRPAVYLELKVGFEAG